MVNGYRNIEWVMSCAFGVALPIPHALCVYIICAAFNQAVVAQMTAVPWHFCHFNTFKISMHKSVRMFAVPIMLYAVVKYFNYRKEVRVDVLATYHSVETAKTHARRLVEGGAMRWDLKDDDEVVDCFLKDYVGATFAQGRRKAILSRHTASVFCNYWISAGSHC